MTIIVKNNDVVKAFKLLNRKLHDEGVLKEVRDRRAFVSRGERKRKAQQAGAMRWKKKRQKLEQQFIREERNQIRNNKNKRRGKFNSRLQKRK
jgi:ribosomal protein S21